MRPVNFVSVKDIGLSLAYEIRAALASSQHRPWKLGFPTGRSCLSVLENLAALPEVNWPCLHVLVPDAYCHQSSDASFMHYPRHAHFSVFNFMQTHLIEPVRKRWDYSFKEAQIWSPDPASPECSEEWLSSDSIDMFLLASGSGDGHVAFNGPGATRHSVTSVVKLADSTRRDNLATYPMFEKIERVPQYGVTMGISTIIRVSKQAILVLPGTEKARSLEMVTSSAAYDATWPATVIHECANSRIYASQE